MPVRRRNWTDEEILDALRRAAGGRPLSCTRYESWQGSGGDGPIVVTVRHRFGSWRAAVDAAGVARPSGSVWTRDAVVTALRRAGEEHGGRYTITEWNREGRLPCVQTVYAVCGSWGAAWMDAGFPPPARWMRRKSRRWTDEEIIDALRRAAGGRSLSYTRYNRWQRGRGDAPCTTTIRNRFGSWKVAVGAAGVEIARKELDRSRVVEAMVALWREIGHKPTQRDWDAWDGRPCCAASLVRLLGVGMPARWEETLAMHPDLPSGAPRSKALRRLLDAPRERLTDREREIAERVERGETLQEIGEGLGLTRERVRQIAMRGGRRREHYGLTRDAALGADHPAVQEVGRTKRRGKAARPERRFHAVEPVPEEDRLLRPREAARILGIPVATVYRLAARGDIRSVKILSLLRIPASEIRRIVQGDAS